MKKQVTRLQHVSGGEEQVHVIVRMAIRNPLVFDLFFAEIQLAAVDERLGGQTFRFQGFDGGIECFYFHLPIEPVFGILMRHDFHAGFAEHFVGTDVIAMPMGIEQDLHRVPIHAVDCLLEFAGPICESTVDHHEAIVSKDQSDVPSISRQHHNSVGEFGSLDGIRRCLAESACA